MVFPTFKQICSRASSWLFWFSIFLSYKMFSLKFVKCKCKCFLGVLLLTDFLKKLTELYSVQLIHVCREYSNNPSVHLTFTHTLPFPLPLPLSHTVRKVWSERADWWLPLLFDVPHPPLQIVAEIKKEEKRKITGRCISLSLNFNSTAWTVSHVLQTLDSI